MTSKFFQIPLTSLSFLNHLMSAAGLLPDVLQVSCILSPSITGEVNPVICGFSGTPNKQTSKMAATDTIRDKNI